MEPGFQKNPHFKGPTTAFHSFTMVLFPNFIDFMLTKHVISVICDELLCTNLSPECKEHLSLVLCFKIQDLTLSRKIRNQMCLLTGKSVRLYSADILKTVG